MEVSQNSQAEEIKALKEALERAERARLSGASTYSLEQSKARLEKIIKEQEP